MSNEVKTVQKLGLDIGSGDTKVYFRKDDGEEVFFKFPTAVRRAKETSSGFGAEDNGSVTMDGTKYIVGEKAVKDAISTRGFDFHAKYAPLLAHHAILKAGFDLTKPIELKIGMTIKDWKESDRLIDRLKKIIINDNQIDTFVSSLYAQGQGAFMDEGSPQGEVSIVEGGYNTLDFLHFTDGAPQAERCDATEYGANKMITNIQNLVNKLHGVTLSEQKAKDIFNHGGFNLIGSWVDMKDVVEEQQEKYLEELFIELSSKHGDNLKLADKIIFTGGLAYFLKDAKLPKNASLGKAPYEYSNVRGYYHG